MTMERCDSFDKYNTSQLPRFWIVTFAAPTIASGVGRNGTQALSFTNENQKVDLVYSGNLDEGYEHFALQWPSNYVFLQVYDNATVQLAFKVRSDRKIEVFRGTAGAGTSLGMTSVPLVSGALDHVQIAWKISDTVGFIVIKINNVERLNLSNQDTKVTTNAYATLSRYGTDSFLNVAISGAYIDDYVFNNKNGTVNNGLIGDNRVKWCPALAEGAQNDFIPSTGTDNAANVDENPANDDTDYNASAVVGDIDYETISVSPSIPTGSTIAAIAVVSQDKKTDGGTRTARHKIRFGAGPTVSNGAAFGPVTTYQGHVTIFEDAITVAEVNAPMQIGTEIMS